MALTKSLTLPLNTPVPDFSLSSPLGKSYSLNSLMGSKGCIIIFTCNHCPYAIAIWPRIITLSHWAKQNGINTVAINPNIHPNYPEDSPEKMIQKINDWQIPFPYLVDEHQTVAKDYQAQCTPDIYLINNTKQLNYHGRFDDNWQNESAVQTEDLKIAISCMIEKKSIPTTQLPSIGCSIKWN